MGPEAAIPMFDHNRASQLAYGAEEDLMNELNLDQVWEINLDPILRDIGTSVSLTPFDQPMQRFLHEPSKPLCEARTYGAYQQYIPYGAPQQEPHGPQTYPYLYQARRGSPSLSYERSSISSAMSPPMESDWVPETISTSPEYNPYAMSRAPSSSQGQVENIWDSVYGNGHSQGSGSCINMRELQPFPNPEEVTFEDHFSSGVNINNTNPQSSQQQLNGACNYLAVPTHPQLENIPPSKSNVNDYSTQYQEPDPNDHIDSTDMDDDSGSSADEEIESKIAQAEAAADAHDSTYHPRASNRTLNMRRRHRNTRPMPSPYAKPSSHKSISKVSRPRASQSSSSRSSNSKAAIKMDKKGPHACTSQACKQLPPFSSVVEFEKHNKTVHSKRYICTFAFAGCPSIFNSKNEWKRHCTSQHLGLEEWECTECLPHTNGRSSTSGMTNTTSNSSSGSLGASGEIGASGGNGKGHGSSRPGTFNRKDLFTQHLRRMHAPANVKRNQKTTPHWEARLLALQTAGHRSRRRAPEHVGCSVCGTDYVGRAAWDGMMECLAKHAEAGGESTPSASSGVNQLVLAWAVHEGVVTTDGASGWNLVGGKSESRARQPEVDRRGYDNVYEDGYEDAEGEEE
jgi:hypothetical protein